MGKKIRELASKSNADTITCLVNNSAPTTKKLYEKIGFKNSKDLGELSLMKASLKDFGKNFF